MQKEAVTTTPANNGLLENSNPMTLDALVEKQPSWQTAPQDKNFYGTEYRPPADAIRDDRSAFEDAVYAKLDELRQLHADHVSADEKAKKDLDRTTQARLTMFLAKGYPQALELMQPANRDFVNRLLKAHDMEPAASAARLFVQIANLQMGNKNSKDGRWLTPARRNERVGLLYRIFHGWNWQGDVVAQKIKDLGGTSKIIAIDKEARIDPEAAKLADKRATTVRAHTGNTVMTPVDGVTVENSGEWRLALVSVHDGGVRVRKLIGGANDSAAKRERDKFCAEEIVHIKAHAMLNGEPVSDAA